MRGRQIILASGSPRRRAFFKAMGIAVEIRLKEVEEVYPSHLQGHEISDYLAVLKAAAQKDSLLDHEILITSDTVVWHNNTSLAKPADHKEAAAMLQQLSGDWHKVITSVCFTTNRAQKTVNHTTHVRFRKLLKTEIDFYIKNYRPFDKAGGYGIQEWIGLVGIAEIKGSYTNVVGLPTEMVYRTLMDMADV